ncbi:hypothetical protein KL946_003227 [Ogataea haglerorum]|uniref:RRN6 beta-propeller domain-containing protein n=1 Tax=Ogataea haglerorum TaxID=1937702 RepID=A0ABQ7RF85_9ASCO|nr:hypothetical protein KL946_003227 [Ogataea haglerorum]
MWPGKNTHLTYGVDGSCTYDRATDSFDFPRLREPKRNQLRPVKDSFHCLVPAQLKQTSPDIGAGSVKLASEIVEQSTDTYFVPKEVLKKGHQESLAALDRKIYDPTYGDLLAVLRYTVPRASTDVLISATGPYGDIVAVSILDSGRLPSLSSTKAVRFSSRIRQIFTIPETHYFGVRTSVSVCIFEARVESKFSVGVARLVEIPQKSLAGQAFAHACVCPRMEAYLALVDVKGNFGLFKLVRRDLDRNFNDYKRLYLSSIHDPAELSNFKKMQFAHRNDELLVMSRSSLHVWSPGTQNCKVVANYWTRLLDLAVPAGQHDYCILLTTREVSVVDMSGFELVLGWSHHLDQQDLSLKLSVQSYDGRFECHIISQATPLVCVVTFGFERQRARVVGDPYFYVPHPSEPLQSIVFVDYGAAPVYLQLTKDLEISRAHMERADRPVEVPERTPPSQPPAIAAVGRNPEPAKQNDAEESVAQLVARFAQSDDAYLSLASIVPTSGAVPSNLESLVAQNGWAVYCASERVFSDVGQIDRLHTVPETLFRLLRPFENRGTRLRDILQSKRDTCLDRISTNLGLSLLTVHKQDQGDHGIEAIRSQLPVELAALLDQWRPHEPQDTSRFSHAEPLSQVPAISTSQSSKRKLKARPAKLAGLSQRLSQSRSPGSSQINASSPASSQIASPPSSQPEAPVSSQLRSSLLTQGTSSQKKRKKRKLGGFM